MKKYIFRFGVAFLTLAAGIIAGSVWIIHEHSELAQSSSATPVLVKPIAVESMLSANVSLPCEVKDGEIEKVKELLAAGANVNSTADSCINAEPTPRGVTLLMKAAQRGDTEMVNLLLENGANVNVSDSWNMTPLIYALSCNQLELFESLVEKGASINPKGEIGGNVLMSAASSGNTKVIEYLLDKGMDINAKDNHGTTALMFAAGLNKPEAVKVLLARGANPELKDNRGRTCLDYQKNGFPNYT